ncbi:MAG TPA: hypothetical protein VK427_16315 [Kofleriaceae bacterium]|nr:hypothetical protein [Kofleriaceae bacterium]
MATRKVIEIRGENEGKDRVPFGELRLDGKRIVGRFGQRTGSGDDTIYERLGERFATEAEAAARFEALISSRLKNYRKQKREEIELPATDDTLAGGAFEPALEREVIGARDAATARGASTVYADWLQQQGDVRGELASLWLAGQEADARAWLANNATKLFGELDVQLDNEVYDLVWEHGFLRGASLKRASMESATDLAELTRTFLALPVARLVTSLRFGLAGYESDNDWGPTLAAVAESPIAAQLRSLRFDDYTSEDCEISWTAFGDFSPYWSQLPALEELVIRSGEGGTLGDLSLPKLKRFARISGGLSSEELGAIASATWPELESLEVWTGDENYGASGSVDSLKPLLEGKAPKTLTHLGIVNCEFVHELIARLAASPLLRQLQTLDLSKGALTDADVEPLLQHADAFAHLASLDLTENLLEALGDAITSRLPNAHVGEQRENDRDSRYVALGE